MPASSGEVIGAALQSVYQQHAALPHSINSTTADQVLDDIDYISHGGKRCQVVSRRPITTLTTSRPLSSGPLKMAGGRPNDDQLEDPRVTLWSKDKVKLGWQNRNVYQGAGMDNLGNTCYMNSSLQALFHIPALVNWLLDESSAHIQKCESNTMSSSFCSICAMTRTLKLALDRSASITPNHIHTKLKCIGKTLSYGRQEDAHEFIKLLLDHMEKSYLNIRKATRMDHRSKETTPLNQIFGGYIRQQVICPLCRYVSTTFSHFQDLVLDIRSVGSVDDALNLHFRKETLDSDNAYKCENCHKKVPATKKHFIEKAPHVLLLQLKRFTMSGGKIGKHVSIQRTIDISRFVCGGGGGTGKYGSPAAIGESGGGHYQYKLVSMVIHIGSSQHGGHYTAVAQASNMAMYEFDDSSVRTIPVQSALLRNPYILFYEMIPKPKEPNLVKQVIRQSSAKTLLRQDSQESASKPLPTSHSSSCVSNGLGKATNDGIGSDVGVRMGGNTNSKSPNKFTLPPLKDREKTVIVIGKGGNTIKGSTDHKMKITLHPNNGKHPSSATISTKSSVLAPPSSSSSSLSSSINHSVTTISSASVARKLLAEKKAAVTSSTSSSLVPYADDSEDSELEETSTKRLSNGVISNNKSGGISTIDGVRKDKLMSPKGKGLNGIPSSQDKVVNGEILPVRNGESDADLSIGATSSTSSSSLNRNSTSFVPRSLQLQSGSRNQSSSPSVSGRAIEKGWVVTDATQLHHTSTLVCKGNRTIPSKQGEVVVKTSRDGWTVTACRSRPELEKSHSHDSVLPVTRVHARDEGDTTSLKSKTSVESCRSNKSVKKAIFSFFPCMTAAPSPDPSPDDDHARELNDLTATDNSDNKKSNCNDDSDSDDDSSQSKRLRDNDTEPVSPSKKCRPEDRLRSPSAKGEGSKNNSRDNGHNKESNNGHGSTKEWPDNHNVRSKCSNGAESDKRKGYRTEKDQNFSMEEKKSRHKMSNNFGDYDSNESSDSEPSSPRINGDKNGFGMAKLNPNINIVQWDQNRTDVSKSLNCNNKSGSDNSLLNGNPEQYNNHSVNAINGLSNGAKYENGNQVKRISCLIWDGSKSTSVVDELRRASNYGLGSKVSTWNGCKSLLDKDAEISHRDAKKRTNDQLYDDDFDAAKAKKSKRQYSEIKAPQGNPFQRLQDHSSETMDNGRGGTLGRSNSWSGSSSCFNNNSNNNGSNNISTGNNSNSYHHNNVNSTSNGYHYHDNNTNNHSWGNSNGNQSSSNNSYHGSHNNSYNNGSGSGNNKHHNNNKFNNHNGSTSSWDDGHNRWGGNNNKYNGNRSRSNKYGNYRHGGKDRFRYRSRD